MWKALPALHVNSLYEQNMAEKAAFFEADATNSDRQATQTHTGTARQEAAP